MAFALLGLVFSTALLIACLVVLVDRLTRTRRTLVAGREARQSSDTGWIPAVFSSDGGADCSSADGGGGCDGGSGGAD